MMTGKCQCTSCCPTKGSRTEGAGCCGLAQMIEEFSMAFAMSIVFSVPTFYICQFGGSFFVFWLAWLISLANGIGASGQFFCCYC